MDIETKIKQRIERWRTWDNGQAYDMVSVPRRQKKLDELVRSIIDEVNKLRENPPAKVTSFNKYENTSTKKNRRH